MSADNYRADSSTALQGLISVRKRPDYYLLGDFDHIDPKSELEVLWAWSSGFLTTTRATEMICLVEGDTLREIARQLDLPLPTEEAVSPEEAALMLGDRSVGGDQTSNVIARLRDGRLNSLRRSDVKARQVFEANSSSRSAPTGGH
jgi:hypothetical protein